MFEKRKKRKAMEKFHDFMHRATSTATILLNMSISNSPECDMFMRYVWEEHHDVVPTVFMIWYRIANQMHGDKALAYAVRQVTSNIADAPLKEASSRTVICDMLFGMQDNNADKATKAWASVVNQQDGWPVAWEVMTVVSSVFGRIFSGAEEE